MPDIGCPPARAGSRDHIRVCATLKVEKQKSDRESRG
jgi:hypothetical protein